MRVHPFSGNQETRNPIEAQDPAPTGRAPASQVAGMSSLEGLGLRVLGFRV